MTKPKNKLTRTLRRLTIAGALSTGLALSAAVPALAANPPGTGQPSQSCGDFLVGEPNNINGFNTAGFTKAALLYAGSPETNSLHANSSAAVSQYDVACFQHSIH